MDNKGIARILRDTAQLLEIDGAIIGRYRSYEKAAELISGMHESIEELAKDPDKLEELPGIGERMAEHLQEILKTGEYSLRKKLLKKYPTTLLDILQLQTLDRPLPSGCGGSRGGRGHRAHRTIWKGRGLDHTGRLAAPRQRNCRRSRFAADPGGWLHGTKTHRLYRRAHPEVPANRSGTRARRKQSELHAGQRHSGGRALAGQGFVRRRAALFYRLARAQRHATRPCERYGLYAERIRAGHAEGRAPRCRAHGRGNLRQTQAGFHSTGNPRKHRRD